MSTYPTQGISEVLALMEAATGKSAADVLAESAAAVYGGDYMAACRQIARLEIALGKSEEQAADLKRRLELAEGTADVLACKGNSPSLVEHLVALNREFETDPATEAFVAGQRHKQRKAAAASHNEDHQIKQAVMDWFDKHRHEHRYDKHAVAAVKRIVPISADKAQEYLRDWKKKTGFTRPATEVQAAPKVARKK